jgi:hypothetical protein
MLKKTLSVGLTVALMRTVSHADSQRSPDTEHGPLGRAPQRSW